jgi:hypothetical protein
MHILSLAIRIRCPVGTGGQKKEHGLSTLQETLLSRQPHAALSCFGSPPVFSRRNRHVIDGNNNLQPA